MARTRVMSSESSRPTMGGRADRAPDGTREKRVLVVDDETVLRQLVAEVLEFEGYLVDQAADWRDALQKIELVRPDAIVLDLMMPVMDGWTFARTFHALYDGEAIPIVVVSASPELGRSAEELHSYGVCASMPKPFDLDELLTVVKLLANRPAVPHRRPDDASALGQREPERVSATRG